MAFYHGFPVAERPQVMPGVGEPSNASLPQLQFGRPKDLVDILLEMDTYRWSW